jgi:hypothetical protein
MQTDLSSLKSGRKPKGQEQLALVATGGGSKRKGHPPGTVLGRLSGVFNPMSLFGSRNRHTIDTGNCCMLCVDVLVCPEHGVLDECDFTAAAAV